MYTLWHGDCLEEMSRIEAGSVDAIITDPPYAIPTLTAQRRKQVRNVGDFSIVEGYFRTWFTEIDRILKPDGRLFIFCDSIFYPVIFRASYSVFNTALLVWDKGRIGMGREFRKSYELILHGWKDDTPIYSDGKGYADIITCPPVPVGQRTHPAQKPTQLIEHLLKFCGSHIFDPYMGTGSTGIAAITNNHVFTGIEINESYFNVAQQRLARVAAELRGELNHLPMFAEAA